jgi:uncharacterized membrane protein YkvA (DUF1232 family)
METGDMTGPTGLNKAEAERLTACLDDSGPLAVETLFAACQAHAEEAERIADEDPIVDYQLAAEIVEIVGRLVAEWNDFSEEAQGWFKAAMHYFSQADDDEPDFESMIGFDDDVRVLNACLRLAGKDKWCLEGAEETE